MPRKKKKANFLKSNRLVKAIKNSSQPVLTAIFVVIGFIVGSIYTYHGIDAYYHTFRTFVAYQDSFKIHFPEEPTEHNLPARSDLPGNIVGSHAYTYTNNSKGTSYLVDATKYLNISASGLSNAQLTSLLQSSVNQTAKLIGGSIESAKDVSFNGLTAAEAELTKAGNKPDSTYLLTFIKGQTIYTIQSSGLTLAQFNSFANSFRFVSR